MAFGKRGSDGPGWRPAPPKKSTTTHGWQCPTCRTGGQTGGDPLTASVRADEHNRVKHGGRQVATSYETGTA